MAAIHHQHPIPPPLKPGAQPGALYVRGMHGLGDNLHQRAVIRQLMERAPVWLETSWPWVYWDLVGPRLHLVRKGAPAQIYARAQSREAAGFSTTPPPADAVSVRINFSPTAVRECGGVLAAMCRRVGVDYARADFRLPLRGDWDYDASRFVSDLHLPRDKPWMIYRPLVERSWWAGCTARNPDHATYARLYREIRERYFVISVADLVQGEEWAVGEDVDVDLRAHGGEIPPPVLAALVARSALVYTAPGFATILAQAVGTPVVTVFGGYEDGRSFSAGARWSRYLPIEPVTPCACFSHDHACDKRIDVERAVERVRGFVDPSQGGEP